MLKKGMALLGVVGLVMVSNLFLVSSPVSAIKPGPNGCFIFKDRPPVCPDKYCLPGTASCSNDGNRCYCRPRILTNTSKNQPCEIIFGSKMVFKLTNGQPIIYIYGGIWSQIAEQIPDSSYVASINGDRAIVFKPTPNLGPRVYTSYFLNDLAGAMKKKPFDFPTNIGISIDAEIDTDSGIGKISNPRYSVIETNTNTGHTSIQSCGHLQNGLKHFFLKYSPLDAGPYGSSYGNICTQPSEILKRFVFGANKDGFFEKKPKVDLTKNCTDKKDSIFSEDNIEIHLLMANLITPQGQSRRIYMLKPDNFLFGEIFNGQDTKTKLERIAEKCRTKCRQANPIDECKYCNSRITTLLRANPNKTLNDIIVENLVKNNQAICSMIDTSFDDLEGKTSGQAPHNNLIPFIPREDYSNQKTTEEQAIDKQLPVGIVKLCDAKNLSANNRLKCKQFALDCYTNNLPEIEPDDMCNQLTGELESSRWIVCPVSNTLSAAADKSAQQLETFFKLNTSSIFENETFKNAWQTFRNISNVFLVLIAFWIVTAQVTGYGLSNYNLKKMLPKLLVAIVLINLSLILCQIVVDLSNIAGGGFFRMFKQLSSSVETVSGSALTVSNVALGVLSGGTILVILSGLSILFPTIIALIIGLVFTILVLSLRHALVVILVLLMPIAIIAGIVPNLDRFFQSWFKNFANAVLLFPTIGFLYGSGIFLKTLLIAVAQDNAIIKLVGFAMPVLAITATPIVLMGLVRALGGVGSLLQQSRSGLQRQATQQFNQSGFNQAWKANQRAFGLKISGSKLANRFYQSKTLNSNWLFAGAGNAILKQNEARQGVIKSTYGEIIGSDMKLLNAFHQSSGAVGSAAYHSLNQGQQQKFRQLANLGAIKDRNFYDLSLTSLASKGGLSTDNRELKQIIANARQNKIDDKSLSSDLFKSGKIAEKAGNPITAGLMSQAADYAAGIQDSLDLDFTTLVKGAGSTLNKTRPANFRVEDFRVTDPISGQSPAVEALRQKIRLNSESEIGSLKGHYLSAIGQDFYQIPLEIRGQIENDIIQTVETFRSSQNRPGIKFSSAEEALFSEGLIERQIGGNR